MNTSPWATYSHLSPSPPPSPPHHAYAFDAPDDSSLLSSSIVDDDQSYQSYETYDPSAAPGDRPYLSLPRSRNNLLSNDGMSYSATSVRSRSGTGFDAEDDQSLTAQIQKSATSRRNLRARRVKADPTSPRYVTQRAPTHMCEQKVEQTNAVEVRRSRIAVTSRLRKRFAIGVVRWNLVAALPDRHSLERCASTALCSHLATVHTCMSCAANTSPKKPSNRASSTPSSVSAARSASKAPSTRPVSAACRPAPAPLPPLPPPSPRCPAPFERLG